MITDPAQLMRQVIAECPRRLATTEDERRAIGIFEDAFSKVDGVSTARHTFRYNKSLYANLALHFGLGVVAAVFSFLGFYGVGGMIAAVVAVSYWADTSKHFLLLRRVFPFRKAENLLATLTPEKVDRRIVVMGHVDAAYTGFLFNPKIVKAATKEPPFRWLAWTKRSMMVATYSVAAVALISVAMAWTPDHLMGVAKICLALFAIPSLLTFLLNLDVVLRNTVVPGASDNLSGCVAALELAHRFSSRDLNNTELVFVVTSCEEASTGGALMLCRDYKTHWNTENTTIVALDTLWGGELRYLAESEFGISHIDRELEERLLRVSEQTGRKIDEWDIPSGATDVWPFIQHGYTGCALVCIDGELGAPRNYHLPSDDMEHYNEAEFQNSVEYADALLLDLVGAP